jgi:hypothetical protein
MLKLVGKFLRNRKRLWRNEPVLVREETLFGKGVTNCGESILLDQHLEANVERRTPNVQRRMQNSEFDVRCFVASYLPAAIRFNAIFTNSSADFPAPSRSCRSRTNLWASTCL